MQSTLQISPCVGLDLDAIFRLLTRFISLAAILCFQSRLIFKRIREGWDLAHDMLLTATDQPYLLSTNPTLDASIRLRLPYIEPLNLLQVELLKRHRAGEDDPRISEGIQLSINAIATALRNSG